MLPNIKVVICGIILTVILFVATGSGIVIPETYTRIGEMPKVGRPMVQQIMTAEPAQAQFQALAATRRDEQVAWLRDRATVVIPEPAAARDGEPTLFAATSDHPNVLVRANVAPPAAEPSERQSAPPALEQEPAYTGAVIASRESDINSDNRSTNSGGQVDPPAPVAEAEAEMPSASPTSIADGDQPTIPTSGAFRSRNIPAPKQDPRNDVQRSASLDMPSHNDSVSPTHPHPRFRLRRLVRRHFVRHFHSPAAPAQLAADPSHGVFGSTPNP